MFVDLAQLYFLTWQKKVKYIIKIRMVKLLESSIYDFGWARDEISFKSHILFGGKKVFNTKGIEIELAEEMLFFIFYWMDLYLIHTAEWLQTFM